MDVIEKRRSYYSLGKDIDLDLKELKKELKRILYYSPNPFNLQATRMVLLTKNSHNLLWDTIVKEHLRQMFDGELRAVYEKRIKDKLKAYGTILFYIDEDQVKEFSKDRHEKEQANMNRWMIEAVGMLQLQTWNRLRELEIGAHVQHYDDLDEEIAVSFDIPRNWKLISLMPFGNILQEESLKEKDDLDKRFISIE